MDLDRSYRLPILIVVQQTLNNGSPANAGLFSLILPRQYRQNKGKKMSTIKYGTLVVIDAMDWGVVRATRLVASGRQYHVRYGRDEWDAEWVDAERIVTAAYLRKVLLSVCEKHGPSV